jgi:C_GCAxxG_C_C family probable redox protein
MSKAETAVKFFESCNCAQAVFAAFAGDCGLETNTALQTAAGFGGGLGRLQETCGAVTGAVMVLGLRSGFKEGDGRGKIDAVYEKVRHFVDEFTEAKGSIKCRDLLGCDLLSEEGHRYFKENNLRENCKDFIRLACELLEE